MKIKLTIYFVLCLTTLASWSQSSMTKSKALLYLMFIGLFFNGYSQDIDKNFNIDLSNEKWTISKYLLGMHSVYSNEPNDFYTGARYNLEDGVGTYAEWMKEAGISTMRYPGGSIVKYWDWKTPNGVRNEDIWSPSWDSTNQVHESEWTGLDEYIQVVKDANITPMFGVNITSCASPQGYITKSQSMIRAKEMVKHVKDQGLGGAFWYLGNEGSNGGWEEEAALVKFHAYHMKLADPDIKIMFNQNDLTTSYLSQYLEEAKKKEHTDEDLDIQYIDMAETHGKWPYGGNPPIDQYPAATFSEWQTEYPLRDRKNRQREWRNELVALRAEAAETGNPDLLFANNEYGHGRVNRALNFDKYSKNLLVIDMLQEHFIGGWDMACYWSQIKTTQSEDTSFATNKNFDYQLNAMHFGFELLAEALDGKMITLEDPIIDAKVEALTNGNYAANSVYGFVAKKDNKYLVYVLNKSSLTKKVKLNFNNTNGLNLKLSKVESMVNTTDELGEIIELTGTEIRRNKFNIELPSLSYTKLTYLDENTLSQTYSGFVVNPSFEDGSAGAMVKDVALNDWKLGGGSGSAEGVSASIQTTNIHAGDGSNALEVTSVDTGGEWNIKVMSTEYPFTGNNQDPIEVKVGFWAKTTDGDPGSAKASGDMRLTVRDVASGTNKSERVLLTTDAWAYIEKTFTFDEAANYNLTLFLEFGLVDGVTQIDGITTSVTGGATLASGITWDGSTDNDWNTATNWTPERVPNAADAYTIIPAGLTNYPTISSGEITVAAIDIKSGAAFVANGTATVTGAATYSRNLTHTAGNTNGWYLVASPLVGATFDDTWVNANSLATGSGTNRGLATYTESANTWDYSLTGESGTFTPGTGYSVKRSATGDVSFTGTINTADTDVTLVRTNNGYNLVANPYTSYINSKTLLDNNPVVSNNKNIYVWNNGTTSYDTKTSTAAFQVAPGQAFFVRSNDGGGILTFEESNQSDNSGTDTFQRTAATIPEIELSVADESTHRYIKLYFNDAATKGFDNGYDGDLFGGVANSFEIYSHLLEDNQGEKYQIQSLPNSDLASMVIPVGLKAASGKELAFSVKKLNLPTDIKVYLEDRVTNTFTLLDETNSVYNITLSSAIDGIGRFYLHTSNSVLSTSDVNLNSVSIFKINNSNLRVAGLSQGKASISLYNILGKQMMMTTFDAINSNDISLPKLAAGVYIVQLTTEAGKLNKKIILK